MACTVHGLAACGGWEGTLGSSVGYLGGSVFEQVITLERPPLLKPLYHIKWPLEMCHPICDMSGKLWILFVYSRL